MDPRNTEMKKAIDYIDKDENAQTLVLMSTLMLRDNESTVSNAVDAAESIILEVYRRRERY